MGVLQGLVANGGYLYAAWKGAPDDDQIFYSRWNGSGQWAPASPMSSGTVGGNTSAGPSLGVFGGDVYAAWKGEWSDPRLFFAKFNGSAWENQVQIPNAYSDVGPALCAFSSTRLIAAWKSVDQSLRYASYNGTTWSSPAIIPGVGSSVGPSLALLGNKLYAAWKGEDTDQGLYYAFFDGTNWSAQTKITNVASSVGPSLATFGGKLYAMWKGENTDQGLYYASFDGTKWSAQTEVSNVASSTGPAIAVFNNKLYAMWKGESSDTRLWDASYDGTKWSAQSNNIPGNTGPDPLTPLATPAGGNVNYLLADSKGAALTGTTVTMTIVDDIVPDATEIYSLQVNCNSPSQVSGAQPFVWQQFGFAVQTNQLYFWTNCYRVQDEPDSGLLYWDSRSMPNNTGVISLSNNRLPSGWQLTTSIATDKNNHNVVTGFTCGVTEANGTVHNWPAQTLEGLNSNVKAANLAPILNFQAIFVGSYGGDTDFSAGHGIFLCYETNNLSASVAQDESGEQSNTSYSPLPAAYPNGEFYQFFGVPSA
jgi:hypothetical protein